MTIYWRKYRGKTRTKKKT